MSKWILTLAAALVLLSGCSEKSGSPGDNTTNPTTAPAPGETVAPPAKPKAFPTVSDPYDADQAAANGDIVNVHGKMYNLDKWKLFLANLDMGMPDQVRITQYTIEGDPIFYELNYDGAEAITYTYDNSMDGFGSDLGRPSTVCRGIELKESKELGSHYELTGCDNNDTSNSFWFKNIVVEAEQGSQ
ncbi:DUF4362 domain-containing protein [Paenibacillus sp. YAF4_2]|uniref:DUF4362 domain-containing protein n=1 Tax=Paenibacillus sp. YAF4_2 TaxID=3233085 RepID=UPI003F9A9056